MEGRSIGPAVLAVIGVISLLIGGWHYLCQREIQEQLQAFSDKELNIPDLSVSVAVGPLNNVIDITVGYAGEANATRNESLLDHLKDAFIAAVGEGFAEHLERSLQTRSRRDFDVYAMLLPYKVSITTRHNEPRAVQADAQDRADQVRAVQHALAACGYHVASDGVLGPTTSDAIRDFRIRHDLTNQSIALPALASLIRSNCSAVTIPKEIQPLIDQWFSVNDTCRDGPSDEPGRAAACEQREVLDRKLAKKGWCYGNANQIMADRDWQPCE